MSNFFPFRSFRKFLSFKFRTSTLATFVRTLLLFSLISSTTSTLFQAPSGIYFSVPAFAQSSGGQANPEESHRLENFIISSEGRDDWTRLMLAILNSMPAVERVLAQGVSINIRGTEKFHGVTPLMFASGIGAQEIVKLLVGKGARLNDTDTQGKTALSQAAYQGHLLQPA